MRRFLARSGAVIAPHGKTTMSPQLFKRQIDDGAWGITIGSVQQLQAIRHAGVGRVVMANQLLGKRAIRYVLEELARDPEFDFYALADSEANVAQLAAAAREAKIGRPLAAPGRGRARRRADRGARSEDGDGRRPRHQGGRAFSRAARRRGL